MDKTLFDEMIATRRKLHAMPEEGWTEFETTYLIAGRLEAIGFEDIRLGTAVVSPAHALGRNPELVARAMDRALANGVPQAFLDRTGGFTGCVGVIATGRPGPVTALRFDIDCVPVEETEAPEHEPNRLGIRSTRPGLMHACGHDGHTAVGLAVARYLWENRARLKGTVKLVFQPAEEGVRGAVAVANSGVLDDVDLIVGSHVGGKCKLGEMGLMRAGVLASTKFDIRFKGEPSHAGSHPHKGRSALMAACATAMMMAGIPRHGDGASRVAVGKLVAGEGRNVTPVHAYMQTEVRGETAEVNEYMCGQVRNIVEGNARAYGVEAEIECVGEATTIIDCPEVVETLRGI
ncbi:MAG: amidohydrolase, partial [Duodenibacillus sp.]|nr:amidohydrolase [Duodenibacillus sp.]